MKKCRACKYYILDDASCCAHCGASQGKIPIRWLTFANVGILATFFMALFIAWQSLILRDQSSVIKVQTGIIKKTFELENRPYLYVDISPLAFSNREKQPGSDEDYDNLYVGAELTYKNVGKLPACNIKSEIYFYSDVDKGDNFERLKKWYIEEFGYFPEPTSVFPHQEGQKIVCKVDCGESTKDYGFTIRVTYTGEDLDKLYWYATDVRYSINKSGFKQKQRLVQQGDEIIQALGIKEYGVYFISATSDYDRDGKAEMPQALSRLELIGK
ncbi:MAG: hypothetical protein WC437_05720 [Patescibacteria group bacterium]